MTSQVVQIARQLAGRICPVRAQRINVMRIYMKPYEFKRFFHPKLGKFVYKHQGSGITVDNIFEPIRNTASAVVKSIAKPFAKQKSNTIWNRTRWRAVGN